MRAGGAPPPCGPSPISTHSTHPSPGDTHHASSDVLGKADPLAPGVVAVLGAGGGFTREEERGEGSPSPTRAMGWLGGSNLSPSTHHGLDEAPQSAPLDVLRDEVESLLLVQHPNKLQHVGVLQAAHHLHLQDPGARDTPRYTYTQTPSPGEASPMEQEGTPPLCTPSTPCWEGTGWDTPIPRIPPQPRGIKGGHLPL